MISVMIMSDFIITFGCFNLSAYFCAVDRGLVMRTFIQTV